MKEEYKYILTLKQKQWLHNQLRILENEWQYLVEEVILRGKYSDYEKGKGSKQRDQPGSDQSDEGGVE